MKLITPNYYKDFKCIADKCHHNCCIGWEIDIDEETLEIYKNTKGKFRKKLKDSIIYNDECSCFKLDGKGRCVFLNKDNLCEIILNLGEDSLCQICNDHPRFRNFYENTTETGLGLCCEEAGRIILGQRENFEIIVNEYDDSFADKDENEFLDYKNEILHTLQAEEKTLKEKVVLLLKDNDINLNARNFNEWIDYYLSLERLDDSWTNLLCDLKTIDYSDVVIPEKYEKVFEKLLLYFIYRHLDGMDKTKLLFSVFSTFFIYQICRYHIKEYDEIQFEDIVEYSRMYSSEIEYSDENIEKIIDKLQKESLE